MTVHHINFNCENLIQFHKEYKLYNIYFLLDPDTNRYGNVM